MLADHLRKQIGSTESITIDSIHRYMRKIILRAGRGADLKTAEAGDKIELFSTRYPEIFEDSIIALLDENNIDIFDTLVVDEGQDILHSPTIDAFEYLLERGYSNGRWIIFYDPDIQSELYGRMNEKVINSFRKYAPAFLPLTDNYRNPEPIFKEMCKLTGCNEISCKRKLVTSVEYLTFSNKEEEERKLNSLIVKLIRDGAKASDITILSCCKKNDSCIERYGITSGKNLLYIESPATREITSKDITACTVSSFKGMENSIIVLTDIPIPESGSSWDRAVIYVGMTRATTKLYALVSDKFSKWRFPEGSS